MCGRTDLVLCQAKRRAIGVTVYPNDGIGHVDLIGHADAAMYRAKNAQGNSAMPLRLAASWLEAASLEAESVGPDAVQDVVHERLYPVAIESVTAAAPCAVGGLADALVLRDDLGAEKQHVAAISRLSSTTTASPATHTRR
jgi:hypothetical protein